MEKITKTTLKKAASSLLLDMTETQYDVLEKEFEILVRQMDLIGRIAGIDETEPMTFPFEVTTDDMREDIPDQPIAAADILRSAGHVEANQIKVPKVVG